MASQRRKLRQMIPRTVGGGLLQQLRTGAGLSLVDLAANLGDDSEKSIDAAHINKIETVNSRPRTYHHRRPYRASHGRPRCTTPAIIDQAAPSGDYTSRDASSPPTPTARRLSAPASPPPLYLFLLAPLPPPWPRSARPSRLTPAVSPGPLVPGRSSAIVSPVVDRLPSTRSHAAAAPSALS